MTIIRYDGTFDGLLSAIYDIYLWKVEDPVIKSRFKQKEILMFGENVSSVTDKEKVKKVRKKLNSLTEKNEILFLYSCFLYEKEDVEQVIYLYCRDLIKTNGISSSDHGVDSTKNLQSIYKKVKRETHRMKAFIRFHEIDDQLYFANCTPDFDVLPLIKNHFVERYQDQKWIIYDLSRNYGIHYDMSVCLRINISFYSNKINCGLNNGSNKSELVTHGDNNYSNLWKTYFNCTNIKSRKNMKLHIQHIPKRYWKYMNEIDHEI